MRHSDLAMKSSTCIACINMDRTWNYMVTGDSKNLHRGGGGGAYSCHENGQLTGDITISQLRHGSWTLGAHGDPN